MLTIVDYHAKKAKSPVISTSGNDPQPSHNRMGPPYDYPWSHGYPLLGKGKCYSLIPFELND